MKKITFLSLLSTLTLFCLLSGQVYCKTFSHEEIEKLAKTSVEAQYLSQNNKEQKISISNPELDPRIHINECNSDLKVNILENQNSRNINVKLSCDDPTNWHIYLTVKVTKLQPVLVAASNIDKGSILDNDNTKITFIEDYKIRGATLNNIEEVLGAKVKRNLQKDSAIYSNNVCIVCKGEMVTILANSSSFQIKTNGTALSNGTVGEQVRIKNNRSGKVISARVKAINKVVINL